MIHAARDGSRSLETLRKEIADALLGGLAYCLLV
jgi:hypothetical protein